MTGKTKQMPPRTPTSRPVGFGPFSFDPTTGELRRGDTIIPLRPKATVILAALVRAEGRLVTREALIQQAWPHTILEADQALHTVVGQIRRALGDSPTRPIYITTVHRRGYRFAARLSTQSPRSILPRLGRAAAVLGPIGMLVAVAVALASRHAPPPDATVVVRAAYLVSRGGDDDVHRAVSMLEPLTAGGTRSSRAWSTLAAAYSRLEQFDPAERTARRALELDERSAEAHRVLAESAMMRDSDLSGAERHFLRALDLDPNNAPAHGGYAFLLMLSGAIDESVREIRRALTLDPLSSLINGDAAWMFFWAGRFREAEEQALRTLQIEPNYLPALECLRLVRQTLGNEAGARDAAVRVLRSVNHDESVTARVAEASAASGLRAYREWRLTRAADRLDGGGPNAWVWYGLALAELGQIEPAQSALARAHGLDAPMLPIVRLDPRVQNIELQP